MIKILKTSKILFLTFLFLNFGFSWDVLRYNPADNSMYIGATRIVSAPYNTTATEVSLWDPSTRTLVKVSTTAWVYGGPVTAYNYNIASTSTVEVAAVDYFQYEVWGRSPARKIYGPSYWVVFDDERQRGSAYPGYSPGTSWVEVNYPGTRAKHAYSIWTGYVKWSRTVSAPAAPSDTVVSESIISPTLDLQADIIALLRPTGTLSVSKTVPRKNETIALNFTVN